MPYCEATTMEILRLADITPEGLPHYTKSPIKLGQYIIPAGHMLMPSLTNVLKGDQESWSRPEDFNPDRSVAGKIIMMLTYEQGKFHIFGEFLTQCNGINHVKKTKDEIALVSFPKVDKTSSG